MLILSLQLQLQLLLHPDFLHLHQPTQPAFAMVHWFQTAAVLIVVALSTTGSNASPAQHLCGSHLVDALYLVCADDGFSYPKREVDSPQGFLPPKSDQGNEVAEYPYKRTGETLVSKRGPVPGGIVEECCRKPCNIFALQKYCGSFQK